MQEKPLSIALREINGGLLTHEQVADPRCLTPDPRGRPRVVLGVAGGIAAYKAVELLRQLTETGHDVRVVPTASALRVRRRAHLVGAVRPAGERQHLGRRRTRCRTCASARAADLVVVAPATADLLARAAHGLADDLLTNTLLTARCPVVLAPAMHTEMWEHPATQANVATLRSRGVLVVEPAVGRLTGKDSGKGRLPDPEELARLCRACSRAAPRRPTWSGVACSCRPAAPASTWTRCATWATAPPASRATPWPAARSPVAPRSCS